MAVFESWIDRQIREATERGEFDNLPGAGKPIPGLGGRPDENWWIKQKLEREDVHLLPSSLSLRKEALGIQQTVADTATEEQVREIVEDLNARILDARRRGVDGPNVVIAIVDVERVVRAWRAGK
jgi:hypothetical protein